MSNNLNENLETLFSRMESFISSKTVVGEPFNIGDIVMLPLVDITFGMGAGSLDKNIDNKNSNDKNVGGLGAKITPSAVIIIKEGSTQLVNIKNQDSLNKLIDMAPGILDKFNLDSFKYKKNKNLEEEI